MADDNGIQKRLTPEEIAAELAGIQDPAAQGGDGGDNDQHSNDAPSDAELEAGRQGWVPKHLYKGDPNKWVDAETFIKRGERFTHNLQREVADLRKKLEAFEGTRKAFAKFHEETIAAKDAEIAQMVKDLKIRQSEATSSGEHALAVDLGDRIEDLNQKRKELKAPVEEQPAAAAAPQPNPVLDAWIEDGNAWFQEDAALRSYAIALGDRMIENGEQARGRAFLDKVKAQMEADFPRKFGKAAPQPHNGNGVEGGGGGGGTRGKTERDLPPEDLALMKQFIAEGYTTKEKFLASYFSRNR